MKNRNEAVRTANLSVEMRVRDLRVGSVVHRVQVKALAQQDGVNVGEFSPQPVIYQTVI